MGGYFEKERLAFEDKKARIGNWKWGTIVSERTGIGSDRGEKERPTKELEAREHRGFLHKRGNEDEREEKESLEEEEEIREEENRLKSGKNEEVERKEESRKMRLQDSCVGWRQSTKMRFQQFFVNCEITPERFAIYENDPKNVSWSFFMFSKWETVQKHWNGISKPFSCFKCYIHIAYL